MKLIFKRRTYSFLLLYLLLPLMACFEQVNAQEFRILTEALPPFNFERDGKVVGISTEVVRELLKRAGHPDNIKLHSWALAYEVIKNKEQIILYSIIKTKKREKLFKWVGPIGVNDIVFFAPKKQSLKIESLDDARLVTAIGAHRSDYGELFLKERGFTNIDCVLNPDLNPIKLVSGRINLWIINYRTGIFLAKEAGVLNQIEVAYRINRKQIYIAFSRNTPNRIIEKWQRNLDNMKSDGMFQKILNKNVFLKERF